MKALSAVRSGDLLDDVKFMNAKQTIKHGNEFPLDAPDAWWDDAGTHNPAPPPKDWAHSAARGIIANLEDRRGIKHGFENLDEAVRVEIVESLAEIIRESSNV
jgi:hypothetical protein